MASGWTTRGRKINFESFFRNTSVPSKYWLALATSAVVPNADTNTFGQLTEIKPGNGYSSGGYELLRNSTFFDVLIEDDTNDRAFVQIKDIVVAASGGPIPKTGSGMRYAILTNHKNKIADREVIAYWDLIQDRSIIDSDTMPLQNLELGAI